MSALCTRSSSCPFLTVSPRRASISTTRPVAREITGTVLEMSGFTVPVTCNCDVALCADGRRQRKLIGMIRTGKRSDPPRVSTRSCGGAPAVRIALSPAAPGQQNAEHSDKRRVISQLVRVIG